MLLSTMIVGPDRQAFYRLNTSDYNVLDEVIFRRIYKRTRIDFDVEEGERWLDLGANIGAFSLYCAMQGATTECYEPDPDNFEVLMQNLPTGCTAHKSAVTHHQESEIPFWRGKLAENRSKYTAIPTASLASHQKLRNTYAGVLVDQTFDGVKMDIEGSEGPLIDQWLLPRCKKLAMEYHTSRDKSAEHLASRLAMLKQHFKVVSYPPEYDRIIAAGHNTQYGSNQLTFYDRMVFCKDPIHA